MLQATQNTMVEDITIPEVRSCLQRLLDERELARDKKPFNLTITALLSFYRKNLHRDMSIETNNNQLKSRLISTGVIYFGPLFNPRPTDHTTKAKRLSILKGLGFCVEHLAFLNATQVELLYVYVQETGLVGNV